LGGRRVVVDPNPASAEAETALRAYSREAELLLVTHGAADHLGIALDLVIENRNLRLVSEPAVVEHARSRGVPEMRLITSIWGWEHHFGELVVRSIETRHLSRFGTLPGSFSTGIPLAFLLQSEMEPDIRILHLGDTAISDHLRLVGELYRPTIALLGIGAAPGYLAELSPREGALAALWLGVDLVLPMHFEADSQQADEFCEAVRWLPRRILVERIDALDTFEFVRSSQMSVHRASRTSVSTDASRRPQE
jgi:L-ascorbate metabolism protein UlaG (beta-lactamase superfamily)